MLKSLGGGGVAGSSAFNAITSGTNTTAAMVVGSGGSLVATGTGSIVATNAPQVQNAQGGTYGFVLADANQQVYHNNAAAHTFTIPANSGVAYPIGTQLTIINQLGGGVVTIAITTDTLILSPTGATGSRSLAAIGVAVAVKVTATSWIISGSGLT